MKGTVAGPLGVTGDKPRAVDISQLMANCMVGFGPPTEAPHGYELLVKHATHQHAIAVPSSDATSAQQQMFDGHYMFVRRFYVKSRGGTAVSFKLITKIRVHNTSTGETETDDFVIFDSENANAYDSNYTNNGTSLTDASIWVIPADYPLTNLYVTTTLNVLGSTDTVVASAFGY